LKRGVPVQILCIDDLRIFQATQPDGVDRAHRARYARTCAEGLAIIGNVHDEYAIIGELWLDHDLGDDRDITEVVRQLLEWAAWGSPLQVNRIYVHTSNFVKGTEMTTDLRRHYGDRHVIQVWDESPYLYVPVPTSQGA
jgi:hypothetical protein